MNCFIGSIYLNVIRSIEGLSVNQYNIFTCIERTASGLIGEVISSRGHVLGQINQGIGSKPCLQTFQAVITGTCHDGLQLATIDIENLLSVSGQTVARSLKLLVEGFQNFLNRKVTSSLWNVNDIATFVSILNPQLQTPHVVLGSASVLGNIECLVINLCPLKLGKVIL